MEVKTLHKGDISCALKLIWEVFEEFEAPDYSSEGIEEFRRFISYDKIIDKINKNTMCFWGCFEQDILTGVIAARGLNHISMLFVKKEHHRKGIARKLIQTVKETCIRESNSNKITVNSSPYAKEFYHRLGFVDTDKEQVTNGIKFIPMVYIIKKY
ncbi:GNAT family N-acetyltransferase [Sporosalibacterium faouarense]|uniref:GNAT family N-acetyltransferase n=1 Tax=Sporosalibacterium faouarense TaxID=516123 RepID=UPI00192B4196|nr:GNAT family N-acetyltransferase [Sporosalibacterium faouarense]